MKTHKKILAKILKNLESFEKKISIKVKRQILEKKIKENIKEEYININIQFDDKDEEKGEASDK